MQPIDFNAFISDKKYHRPLIFNLGLWFLAFGILVFVFSKGQMPLRIDYIYTTSFLVFMAIPVSLNFYVLIPKFLKQERYWLYALCFLVNLLLFVFLFRICFNTLLEVLFPDFFFISYLSENSVLLIFTIFLVATTLLKLAEDWFYFNAFENKQLRLKNTQIETQLSALRAQMNPHFLFNALNVIYSMALENRQEVTKAIVELSDILRYVIYDSDTEKVSLKQELDLIKNYIAFQKYRTPKDTVSLKIDIEDTAFKIYPMLLLPLIENSFKYGIGNEDNEKIQIKLFQKADEFSFFISNKNSFSKNTIEDNHSGVGLKTIRRNLNLVYPSKHSLTIDDNSNIFKVTLKINDAQ